VLTASQPFTSALVMSNPDMFKYEWVWEKTRGTGFLTVNKMPLKVSENILVFYTKPPIYNPQKFKGKPHKAHPGGSKSNGIYGQNSSFVHKGNESGEMFPRNVIKFAIERGLHPTQKPVKLMEYLIKTYTNEGDLVLDNCAGSGTTGVACINTNRNYILIEKEPEYIKIAEARINSMPKTLF
jgi:site-specific DNA-methyltransferase (adenine-specific)